MQERRNSSALAMELRLSCINPSTYPCPFQILAQMLDMRRSNLKKVVFKGTNVKKVTREKIEGLLKETEDGMTDGSINSETGEAPKFGLLSSAPKFRSNVTSPRSTHDRTPPPMDISQNDDVTMDNDNYLSDGAQTPLETLSNNLKDIEKRLVHIVETKRDSPRSSTASLMSRRSRLSRTRLSLDNPTAAQSDDSGSVILANGDDSDPKEGSDSSKKARAWVPRGRQSIDDALIHAMMAANGTVSRADLARLSKGEIPADLALPPSPTPSTETVQHLRISQVRQDSLGSVHLGDEEDQGKKSPSLPALPMKPGAFKAHADTDLLYHWVQSLSGMMMSSNGNIFCVTGPLCGEFTGHPASDAQLWCFLWSAPEQTIG